MKTCIEMRISRLERLLSKNNNKSRKFEAEHSVDDSIVKDIKEGLSEVVSNLGLYVKATGKGVGRNTVKVNVTDDYFDFVYFIRVYQDGYYALSDRDDDTIKRSYSLDDIFDAIRKDVVYIKTHNNYM
jgi:hypothetical protein